MADWKLEKVGEESRVVEPGESESNDGKVWLLTLVNERDIFVFANAPRLFEAARMMMQAADKRDNEKIKQAVGMLTVAVLLASGDQPVNHQDEEILH